MIFLNFAWNPAKFFPMNEDLYKQELKLYFTNILNMGGERAVADLVVNAIEGDKIRFDVLKTMCFQESYPLCMRSARALQLYCEKDVSLLLPDLEDIIRLSLESKVEGVKRNFLKVLNEFVDFSLLKNNGYLLDKCFQMIADTREKPGIRIHSMLLLNKFAAMETDIANELSEVLAFLDEDFAPSILCVKRKVQAELNHLKSASI